VRVTSVSVYVDGRRARAGRKKRKASLDLKRAKRARVSVRVVVATTDGTVTVSRRYRVCRPRR
jgi:hypothetical protein